MTAEGETLAGTTPLPVVPAHPHLHHARSGTVGEGAHSHSTLRVL
jgi:hypothetical protein